MSTAERRRARKVFGGRLMMVMSAITGSILMIKDVYSSVGLGIIVFGMALGGTIIRGATAEE